MLHLKTKWKSPTRIQNPFEVRKHSRESSSRSVETKRSAIISFTFTLKRKTDTDDKNKNGYRRNHIICTVFQSTAVVQL